MGLLAGLRLWSWLLCQHKAVLHGVQFGLEVLRNLLRLQQYHRPGFWQGYGVPEHPPQATSPRGSLEALTGWQDTSDSHGWGLSGLGLLTRAQRAPVGLGWWGRHRTFETHRSRAGCALALAQDSFFLARVGL